MTHKTYIPIHLEIETEDEISPDELNRVKRVVSEEMKYVLSNFDSIQDAIAERISSEIIVVRVKPYESS